jgi:4-amino-4-deoxy-L-arabinose transferase-like glycosyltransferase
VRPTLLSLLAATGLLYLYGLSVNGWANAFYSAAVQAGTQSWKAFLFGSSDAANFITVDKPPASLWVMEISARVFGLSSWSILVPQALMGVASVGLVYLAVRRVTSAGAGLVAGAVLAVTPVATLMFRFNNPDALLVLLLTAAAYATVRAIEGGSRRWIIAVGALVGLAFLTKSLQAFLPVPAFAFAYLVAAPRSLGRRLVDLLIAAGALVVSAGWWVALVQFWPASSRPYIGGSQTNSVWELIWGYNGLGRLSGNETGSVTPGGAGGSGAWGPTGLGRLFNSGYGGQAAWLIPAALVLGVVLLVVTLRAPRTDRLRASAIMWLGWLLITGLTFSFAQGIIHEYYTVALAPAIGALVGLGGSVLWRRRHQPWARITSALVVAGSALWAFVLLDRSESWLPWLRYLVLVLGVLAAVAILGAAHLTRRLALGVAGAALVAVLIAPTAYSLQTVGTAQSGSLPTAGPTVTDAGGGFGGRGGFGPGGQAGTQNGPPSSFGGQTGGPTGAPTGGQTGGPTGGQTGGQTGGTGSTTGPATGGQGMPQGGAGRGGGGGLLNASTPSAALVAALESDAGAYTWVAATVGAQNAAGYQLATNLPVMALGGFNGSDPWPTLAVFQEYVAAHKIHYFIASGGLGGANGSTDTTSQITSWVEQNYQAKSIGGTTVYDLSSTSSSSSSGTSTSS